MSSLCYNISVIYMNNEYNYYIRIIKPIEKRYNFYCILYSIFKFNWLYKKKTFYNKLLVYYYRMLQKNIKYSNNLVKEIIKK